MEREIIWRALYWEGFEHLRVRWETDGAMTADSVLVAAPGGELLRFWYRVTTAADGTTTGLTILRPSIPDPEGTLPFDSANPAVDLVSDGAGSWRRRDGVELPELRGCLEVDFSLTPFTNTLPIRRLNLAVGESAEILALYVLAPQLELMPQRQRYTRLTEDRYRYEGLDTSYENEITVDADGLVIDYPELWQRVWPQ